MKKKYSKKPQSQLKIANARIQFLFELAKKIFPEDRKLADKYVETAIKIALKNKAGFTKEQKKMFCKNCHCFLAQGKNCRVRIHKHRLIYYCQNCKSFMRFPVH
ncbi:MAG TPA: ribonuclease P [Candidatus Nanoarchaeia archaeon]|nr:ribonuclease P [Candidatus Nanoarchaeia archaeon]